MCILQHHIGGCYFYSNGFLLLQLHPFPSATSQNQEQNPSSSLLIRLLVQPHYSVGTQFQRANRFQDSKLKPPPDIQCYIHFSSTEGYHAAFFVWIAYKCDQADEEINLQCYCSTPELTILASENNIRNSHVKAVLCHQFIPTAVVPL